MAIKSQDATFAGGCFWGIEWVFFKTPGVLTTEVGYSGGHVKDATYEQVCGGKTGHAEAVHITFDPSVVSYEQLLKIFFENHDPTTRNRQGPDVGEQYRSVVFYHSPEQKVVAEKFITDGVVTEVIPATDFYRAEEYHQKYFKTHPERVCHI